MQRRSNTRGRLRKRRLSQRRGIIESLEIRRVLAAPQAINDSYDVNEDTSLVVDPTLVSASFDTDVVIAHGANWDYLDKIENNLGAGHSYPVDGSGRVWNSPDFDVSTSTIGPWGIQQPALLGAGTIDAAPIETQLEGIDDASNGQNLINTYLFRSTFTLDPDEVALTTLRSNLLCDDGCLVYINGEEAFELNLAPSNYNPPGNLTTETLTDNGVENDFTDITFDTAGLNLQVGLNTIAVEVHQISLTSSDTGFDLALFAGGESAAGFVYEDGVLGTVEPSEESGELDPTGGETGAGLKILLGPGPIQNQVPTSGGWSRDINIPSDTTVDVSFNYRMIMGDGYESSEFGEAIFEIDGIRYGSDQNDSLVHIAGDNTSSGNDDTGWLTADFSVPLTGGVHSFLLAAYNNRATQTDEFTEVYYDNVSIELTGSAATILGNDTDADGDTLTASIVDSTSNGIVQFASNGSFRYTPNPNFFGTDSFTYLAHDGQDPSNLATVTINVLPVNDAPTAVADAYQGEENRTLAVNAAAGVLGNDTDIDSNSFTAALATNSSNGNTTLSANGSFTYIPDPGFVGIDSFTYTATDGGATSPPVTVTLTVIEINDSPISVNDTYDAVENVELVISTAQPAQPVTVFSTNFDTVPPEVNTGNDIFLTDGQGYNGIGNDGNVFSGNLLRNDAAGNPATATVLTLNNLPAHTHLDLNFLLAVIDSWNGTGNGNSDFINVEVDGNIVFSETLDTADSFDQTYSPPADVFLVDGEHLGFADSSPNGQFGGFFVDSALDMSLESSLSNIAHTASTLQVRFFASGSNWSGGTNESFGIDNLNVVLTNESPGVIYGVLGNDSDPEGDAITAALVTDAAHGSVTLNADGTFSYTPDPNYFGVDTFTYIASDAESDGNLATVTINIAAGPNGAPVADDDQYAVSEDNVLVIAADGVLDNDSDDDGDTLTASLVADASNGNVTLNSDGSFSYVPDAQFNGVDSFTYAANDGQINSLPATVSITVNAVDDPPVAFDDFYFVEPGQPLVINAANGVLSNDTDPDSTLTAVVVTPPSHGNLVLGSDGSINFTLDQECGDTAIFTYRATDGTNDAVANVTVVVNFPPNVVADSYTVVEDQTLVVNSVTGLLANDSDGNGAVLEVRVETQPTNGSLSLGIDGAFTYSPNVDFSGVETFTYIANDGIQDSQPQTVTIDVTGVNDAPDAKNDSYTVLENQVLNVNALTGVLADDVDVDGPALTATLATNVTIGNLVFNSDGSFDYTTATDATGEVTFTYTISDGQEVSLPATVTIDVTPAGELVVINEVMYHPASEDVLEEWIELHNTGPADVNVEGWRLNRGVDFTFPDMVIPSDGYLVVAANLSAFNSLYPSVSNVVGGWVGQLSNSGEDIELEGADGSRFDFITYSDQGDWAIRRAGPNDNGSTGWEWVSLADGLGSTIELINPAISNRDGQNWLDSPASGTPGVVNSVASSDIAPVIQNVSHSPALPTSSESVVVKAEFRDELDTGVTGSVQYRVSNANNTGAYTTVALLDDGLGDDVEANDGTFTATLPPQNNQAVVEFYIESSDGTNSRTWPAPSDNQGGQDANLLYQVENSLYNGDQPIFRLVMTEAEDNEFQGINRNSNARMNTTFIYVDKTGSDVRYQSGVRVRGASSRFRNPPGLRLDVPADNPWNNIVSANLNNQYGYLQTTGMTLFQMAGLAAYDVTPVQVELNGANYANSGSPQYGSYVFSEVPNSDYTTNHLPDDPNGNIYKKVRPDNKWDYHAGDVNAYLGDGWTKETNSSENDWTDLDNLMNLMNNASGADYYDQIKDQVNADQWVRWFALMMLMNNRETNLSNGTDDDYMMYRGVDDPRFILLPHDHDTIFGQGDTNTNFDDSIFPVIDAGFAGQRMPQFDNFFADPIILNKYYAAIHDLTSTVMSAGVLNPLLDNTLSGYVPQNVIDNIKTYAAQRVSYVLSQIPAAITEPFATVDGEPLGRTPLDDVALAVGGDDIVAYRYSLDGGAYGVETTVETPLTLTNLADGVHSVSVIGKNSNNDWQAELEATVSTGWTVDSNYSDIRISEVLASNATALNVGGTFPDFIELFNAGNSLISLDGMSLTDDPTVPAKYVFDANAEIPSGQYLTVYADTNTAGAGIHTGFSLRSEGEGVYLFDTVANGGGELDGVVFGQQITDLSIGRDSEFQFQLGTPTPDNPNTVVALGNANGIVINEWLTDGQDLFLADRFEIYNADTDPVSIGGFYMTDNPAGEPTLHRVSDLSFLGPESYSIFIADRDITAGADHVNFLLSSTFELLGVFDQDLNLVDQVVIHAQETDVSQGRSPDGGADYERFSPPSLGFPNAQIQQVRTDLVSYTDSWSYEDSGQDLGTAWRETGYNDSAWSTGAGLFYTENQNLPAALNTQISDAPVTHYFRSHFNVTDLSNTVLEMSGIIDDGAIIYINGQEVARVGVPAGEISASTTAARSIGVADIEGPVELGTTELVVGDNVIAVELHNLTANSDAVFGLEVDLIQTVTIGGLPDVARLANQLRITEVMYNPLDGSDFEFVELQNVGAATLDLSGVSLSNGVTFTFPDIDLAPGEYIVVVNDLVSFESRYGNQLNVAGEFSGKLDNAGENLELTLPAPFNGRILDFTYQDSWFPETDGPGNSLVIFNANGDTGLWDEIAGWRSSFSINGSPGTDDTPPPAVVTVTSQLTNSRSPMLTGTITDDLASIVVTVEGNDYNATNNGDGTWTLPGNMISPLLGSGVFDIAVVASSVFGVGNDETALELTIDIDAPTVAVDTLGTRDTTPGLTGTVSDPLAEVRITIGGTTYLATNNGDGTWSLADDVVTPALSIGLHNVCMIARDSAGNLGADATTDELNILPPDVLIVESIGLNADQVDPADLPKGPQPTSWETQRSQFTSIVITFSQNVVMDVNDIRLTNLGINAPADSDSLITITPDLLSVVDNVATITFSDPTIVTDGVYQLEVLPTATDAFGIALDGDDDGNAGGTFVYKGNAQNQFHKLLAEWSGDSGVSVFDFSTFSYWFGFAVPLAPDYSDLNRDGGISVFDFSGFSDNFGIGVTYPVAFQAIAAAPADTNSPPRSDENLEVVKLETPLPRTVIFDNDDRGQLAARVEKAELDEVAGLDEFLDDIASDVALVWSR
jgi:VCBS repeat-containing protein